VRRRTNIRSRSNTVTSNAEGASEDEIIALDKENVNPGAFRRKAEKDKGVANTNSGTRERIGLGGRSRNGKKRTLSAFKELGSGGRRKSEQKVETMQEEER
jgi:hypothetical protein